MRAGGVYSIRLYRQYRSICYEMTRGKEGRRTSVVGIRSSRATPDTSFLEYLSDGVTREEFWQVCTPYFSFGNVVLVLFQRTMSVVPLNYSTVNVQSMSVKCLSFSPSGTSQQQNNPNAGRLLGGDGKKKRLGVCKVSSSCIQSRLSRQKSRRVADTQVEGVEGMEEIVEEISPVPCQFLPD